MNKIKNLKCILFAVFLCMIFVISFIYSCLSSSADIIPLDLNAESKLEFFDDGSGGIVVFEYSNQLLTITKSKDPIDKIKVPCNYNFSKIVGKNIYIFENQQDDSKTSIRCYSISKNEISSPTEYSIKINSCNDIAILKNSKALVVSSFNRKNMFSFTVGKPKISGYVMKKPVKSIKNNVSGSLCYVQVDNETDNVVVYDKNLSKEKSVILSLAIKNDFEFLCDNVIVDTGGNVFSHKVDSAYDFEKIKTIDLAESDYTKCLCKNYIITLSGNSTLKFFDISNSDKNSEYQCSGDVKFLASYKEKLLIVEQSKNEFCLRELDIEEIVNPLEEKFIPKIQEDIIETANTDNQNLQNVVIEETENSSESSSEISQKENFSPSLSQSPQEKEERPSPVLSQSPQDKEENSLPVLSQPFQSKTKNSLNIFSLSPQNEIESRTYKIDYQKNVITNVDLETTISKFKKNIETKTNNFKIIKNNKSVSSGKVGTGTKIQLVDQNGKLQVFTVIVKGDVTGSGYVNVLDIRAIYNHIFKNRILEGFQLEAADINNDGKVDTLDLLSISKMQR